MKPSEKGFTLVELLIALAIASVIGTTMAALFAKTVTTRSQIEADGMRVETGRYALDVLADDLRLAGFYGDFQPRSSSGAWPPDSLADNVWSTPDPCNVTLTDHWENASATSAKVPVAIQGYELHGTVVAAPACLDNHVPGTDILVVRRVSSVAYLPGAAPDGVYLQASNCNNTATDGGLKFKTGSPVGLNLHELNCTTLAKVRRYIVRVYYVASCNICAPVADGVPTLSVVELQSVGGVLSMSDPRQVAPGVEDMHVEYGIDANADGSPDTYEVSTDTATPLYAWQNVMAVKVYLLVRDLNPTRGYVNAKDYVLGQQAIAAKNDDYKRAVFSETVRLVNPSGAREP